MSRRSDSEGGLSMPLQRRKLSLRARRAEALAKAVAAACRAEALAKAVAAACRAEALAKAGSNLKWFSLLAPSPPSIASKP